MEKFTSERIMVVTVKELIVSSDGSKAVYDELLNVWSEFSSELQVSADEEVGSMKVAVDNGNKAFIIKTIADAIVEHYEKKIIYKIINVNYNYFNNAERKNIFASALKYVDDEGAIERDGGNGSPEQRLRIINEKLEEYLETNEKIVLEGFVNFRLKEYVSELEEIVERAVDDFLIEKEYKEFIKLLKYFVELQPPREEIVHIVVGGDRKYILYNGKKRDITQESSQDLINNIKDQDINFDDLLVSALITISPRKIYFHKIENIENNELVFTIKNVFDKRVLECEGCELCGGKGASEVKSDE